MTAVSLVLRALIDENPVSPTLKAQLASDLTQAVARCSKTTARQKIANMVKTIGTPQAAKT